MTIPTNRTLNTSKEDHVADHNAMAAAVNVALPAATPFTTTTMPNPITGSGTMTVLLFPAPDTAVLAIAIQGDSFPRLLMPADADSAVLYLGDGTTDPWNGNAFIGGRDQVVEITNSTRIHATTGISVHGGVADLEVTDVGHGVILRSPDNTRYRITVNNDGSLSTTVVP